MASFKLRALVLPGVKRIQPETLKRIVELHAQGAKVIVQGGWPREVPGFHQQAERREALLAQEKAGSDVISCEGSIIQSLSKIRCHQERMTDFGLRFVRRTHAEGYHYFIVNHSKETFDRELPLGTPFQSAMVLDPWSPSQIGVVSHRSFSLRLQPGSWTTLPEAANFSGTARYTTTFNLTAPLAAACRLVLGRVAHTARVTLNGQALGISWCAPHAMDVSRALKPGENLVEIEVTNLAANRIADLDRRMVPWKRFHEINFVNIDYKLFDAAGWEPMESGLLGPVRLLVPKLK